MDDPSASAPPRAHTRLALAAILTLAALFRIVTYVQVRDGSILYFHRAADTDMNFFDAWARLIAKGDLLAAPRPYHPWHHQVAREVHERTVAGQPFDEATGRRMWDHWMGARTLYQDPLYAYLLAASYRLFGPRIPPVLLVQGLLGLLSVFLTFVIARTLWDDTVGLVAAALTAFYAPLVFFELTLLRAALQAFLILLAVAGATLAQRSGDRRWWLATGLAGGLAVLTHAVALPVALALCASAWWAPGPRSRRAALLAAVAGLALALSPLVVRNVAVGLPPWSSGTAQGYGAHNLIASHAVDANPREGFPFSAYEGRIFSRTDARLFPTLREALATHPTTWSWLALMGRKVLAFFDGWENSDNINFYYFLVQAPLARAGLRYGLLMPLAALGLAVSARLRFSPPALAVAGGLLGALLFFTASRVRLSAALAMVPFAAAGLVEALRLVRSRRARALVGPALAAAVAGVVAAAPWWPRPHLVRTLDYRTGNVLGLARWDFERQGGHPELALRILEKQLATEPHELRTAGPSATVPAWAAPLAGSFAELHRAAVGADLEAGRAAEALSHAEHARVLGAIARRHSAGAGS